MNNTRYILKTYFFFEEYNYKAALISIETVDKNGIRKYYLLRYRQKVWWFALVSSHEVELDTVRFNRISATRINSLSVCSIVDHKSIK